MPWSCAYWARSFSGPNRATYRATCFDPRLRPCRSSILVNPANECFSCVAVVERVSKPADFLGHLDQPHQMEFVTVVRIL